MDQTTYFLFRCPACTGRSRVATVHAGHTIVCPHCQANGLAQPEPQARVRPQRPDGLNPPVTTKRFAQPFGSGSGNGTGTGTASLPRPQSVSGGGTQELFADERTQRSREMAPGMSGFADQRPATTGIHRQQPATATVTRASAATSTVSQPRNPPGRPAPAAPTPSNAPFFVAAAAAATFALLTIWAVADASSYRTRYQQVRTEADKGVAQYTDIQATAETLDKRLARTQVELAAAQAAIAREREIVADLQKTVGRLGEDLAKASRVDMPGLSTTPSAATVNAITSNGTFPTATLPIAGVPMTRRDTGQSTLRGSK